MRNLVFYVVLFVVSLSTGTGAQIKLAPVTRPANQPGFTLHAGTRIVLTDVLVTDEEGKPIRGLGRSAFRIFDDGRQQAISSFEEHATPAQHQVSDTRNSNVYSNAHLTNPPAAFTVVLIDITTLKPEDQMYLGEQLTLFVKSLPAGQRVAIYGRDGLVPWLLQDFTSDHALLLKAVATAVPHLRQTEAQFAVDEQALESMVGNLKGLPGRKNLIWFSGGNSTALWSDPSGLPLGIDMRPIYDALEASRIAVFRWTHVGFPYHRTSTNRSSTSSCERRRRPRAA